MYFFGLFGRMCGWLLVAAGMLLATAWMAAVLYFDGPFHSLNIVLAGACVAIVVALAIFTRSLLLLPTLFLALCFGVGAWWVTIPPSQGRAWPPGAAQLPWAESDGEAITLHNVRQAEWRSPSDGAAAWETRTIPLSEITGVDLFLCASRCPLLAQPIVSFQFAHGPPLCVSVEPRCEEGERFAWWEGFFRRFETMCVFAEERDLLKQHAGFGADEVVYLYRLDTSPERARALFVDYLQLANRLNKDPEWYHTLSESVASSLRLHRLALSMPSRFDWRLLFTGQLDERALALGHITSPLPLAELRRLSRVNGHVRVLPADAEFSSRLREAIPAFGAGQSSE